jgi:hypothetical protein
MLKEHARLRDCFERGVITEREIVLQLLGSLAWYKPVDPDIVPSLWELVPERIQERVRLLFSDIAGDAHSESLDSIRSPMTLGTEPSPLEIEANVESVRAWAKAIVCYLIETEH